MGSIKVASRSSSPRQGISISKDTKDALMLLQIKLGWHNGGHQVDIDRAVRTAVLKTLEVIDGL